MKRQGVPPSDASNIMKIFPSSIEPDYVRITCLRHLIAEKKWDDVDYMLIQHATSKHSSSYVADDAILHYACRCNAPLRTIARLAAAFPSSLDAADDHGRYPIHVAVAAGCAPEIVLFFAKTCPATAGAQDELGRTPMHYVPKFAQSFVDNCRSFPDFQEVHLNTISVVETLADAAPGSVNVEDCEEMNSIEYAILNSMHVKVIKAMQRVSRKDWRRRKTIEGKSHEELVGDVQRCGLSLPPPPPVAMEKSIAVRRGSTARMA